MTLGKAAREPARTLNKRPPSKPLTPRNETLVATQSSITPPPRAALAQEKTSRDEEHPSSGRLSPMTADAHSEDDILPIEGPQEHKPEKVARDTERVPKKEPIKRKTSLFNGGWKGKDVVLAAEARKYPQMSGAGIIAHKSTMSDANGSIPPVPKSRVADLERALQAARDEQEKMQEQLDAYRQQEEEHEEEMRLYREDRQRQGETIEEQERSIEVLRDINTQESDPSCADLHEENSALRRDVEFWQQKHVEVNHQYLRIEREQQAQLAEQHASLRAESDRLVADLEAERDAHHSTRRMRELSEGHVQELQRQVLDLKRSISTSTRTEGQVTDDVFREQIQTLGHELQNWTINNFRRSKIVPSSFSTATHSILSITVPDYKNLFTANKLAIIQALISALLVHDIFSALFFGLPAARTEQLQTLETYFRSLAPPAAVNAWRSTTLALVRHTPNTEFHSHLTAQASALHERISSSLAGITGAKLSEACERGLKSILEQAVKLAHLFRVQRARFEVYLPRTDALFDSATMEDVRGDESDFSTAKVECVTFMGVEKWGDEGGDNVHLRNVITRAKVLCQEG